MIGIFDSGLGGLTVVKELFRVMPHAPILYLGDLARMPYGTKSKETICKYAEENTKFLISRGATSIVIACNTASSLAYDHLKNKFPNIPIFEVVTPAAKKAASVTKNGKIGIIGTRATIASGVYEKKILELDPLLNPPPVSGGGRPNPLLNPPPPLEGEEGGGGIKIAVFSQSAPLLVSLIEEGWLDQIETKMVVRRYLHPLRRHGIDTLILGCTHFPLIKGLIQAKIGKRVRIVDSAEEVVNLLMQEFPISNSQFPIKELRFFVTDLTPHWQAMAEKWLGRRIELELISL